MATGCLERDILVALLIDRLHDSNTSEVSSESELGSEDTARSAPIGPQVEDGSPQLVVNNGEDLPKGSRERVARACEVLALILERVGDLLPPVIPEMSLAAYAARLISRGLRYTARLLRGR